MSKTVVLAAGGTGGHIFPAEAVATELANKGYKVVFITDKSGQRFDRLSSSVQVMILPMHRRHNSVSGLIKFGWGILKSMYHVYRGFKVMKPQIVIGFGGYPSFPAVSVAQGLKIPTIIHEQNAVLGQVNRILSKYTKHVAVSFEQTERLTANVPVTVTGTPVRNAFYMFRETNYTQLKSNDAIYLLITGGSQGARIFSTIIPVAVSQLPESTRQRLCLIHQCPPKDVEHLKAEYTKYRINATVIDFIENMAEAISKAHLIIARAGASTLAELSIVGRPAILVPFPGAKDDHQWVNAQSIEATKAGWCVRQERFSVEYLVHQLELLIQNPKMLYDAAMNMKAFGRPKATEHIVNLIETQLNKD